MHSAHETKALSWKCFDKTLLRAGVADRASDGVQPGRQRRIRYNPTIPNRVYEIVLADDAIPAADQILEQIENLWRRVDQHLAANGPYLLGDRFSAADIFAYMLSTWQSCCPNTYERFPSLKRLADLVAARPAMQRVIQKNAA